MTQDNGMDVQDTTKLPSISPSCRAKHTKYQPGMPGSGPWECPKCGTDSEGGFIIDEVVEGAQEDCPLLHIHDICVCFNCGFQGKGNGIARSLAKKHNVVTCPHCKGKGYL